MLAIDTNILVYAETPSSEFHQTARDLLAQLTEGSLPWAIPWPCVYEFLRVITYPHVRRPPLPLDVALDDLQEIFQSPSLRLLSETPRHAEILDQLFRTSHITSNIVHDAHIAVLCIEHGITELITADHDFTKFPLKVRNPFRP